MKNIVFVGERTIYEQIGLIKMNVLYQDFDNTGAQCGGWSLRWQGFESCKYWNSEY